jgi:hypothetical protein
VPLALSKASLPKANGVKVIGWIEATDGESPPDS